MHGAVIGRINARFGTCFRPFEHNEENVRRCFAIVEQMDMEHTKLMRAREATEARS